MKLTDDPDDCPCLPSAESGTCPHGDRGLCTEVEHKAIPNPLPKGRPVKTMTETEIHFQTILDTARSGDRIAVTRSNGGDVTSYVEGPVLAAPDISRAVGIDLLDGEPHVVRREDGAVFGHIIEIELARKEPHHG